MRLRSIALRRQFGNRSAYAFSIQTPDKKRAIGAFFINRPDFAEAGEPVPEEANKEWCRMSPHVPHALRRWWVCRFDRPAPQWLMDVGWQNV